MADSQLKAIMEVKDFEINLKLTPLQAAALLVVGHHIGGKQGSLRTIYDQVSDSLGETLNIDLFEQTGIFEELVQSIKPYHTEVDDLNESGLWFEQIDLDAARNAVTNHLAPVWDEIVKLKGPNDGYSLEAL